MLFIETLANSCVVLGYLEADSTLSWNDAWDARVYYSLDSTEVDSRAGDHSPVVDGNGDVHVVYESWEGGGQGSAEIAYKASNTPRWSSHVPSWHLAESSAGGHSPTICLEAGNPEVVHAAWRDSSPWLRHAERSLSESDSTWSVTNATNAWPPIHQPTTPEGNGQPIVVDRWGDVHFFGKRLVLDQQQIEVDSVRVLHVYGTPSESDNWANHVVILDAFDVDPNDPEPGGHLSAARSPVALTLQDEDMIDVTWARPDGGTREIYFSRIFVREDTTWFSPPVAASSQDGILSRVHWLAHGPDGRVHLMHRDGGETVFYTYSDDPTTAGSWAAREPVVPDWDTWTHNPSFVVHADTLLALLESPGLSAPSSMWFRKGLPVGTEVADGDSATWSGTVYLDEDFVVQPGGTLTIEPGTRVMAKSSSDTAKVELIVRGTLTAAGEPDSLIRFESTEGEAGDWGGIVFDLEGCERTGYGYAGCLQPLSALRHAQVKDGAYGIVLEDVCAPVLEGVAFADITQDRHIFLKSDAMIPYGYWPGGVCHDESTFVEAPGLWDLGGGTHVKASTSDTHDASWVGVSGKNDLLVYGEILTDSTATGDSVYFEPDVITDPSDPSAGDDWGGIMILGGPDADLERRLRFADIGYAANPVFLGRPDELMTLSRSRVHHFADVGVWVWERSVEGVGSIDGCVVDRGSDLYHSLGGTGILVDQSDQFTVQNTEVRLEGRSDSGGGGGIRVYWGTWFCGGSSPGSRTLTIRDNVVLGPGYDVTGEDYYGIASTWVCGSAYRDVDLLENYVSGWKFAGLELVQTSNMQVSCNRIEGNRRGAHINRTDATGTSIRFKENTLEAKEQDSAYFALRTNQAAKTDLGPSGSDKGLNRLTVYREATKFIYETDSAVSHVLEAQDNYWYKWDGSTSTLLTDSDSIKVRCVYSPDTALNIADFETEDETQPACWPPDPSTASAGRNEELVSDRETALGATEVDVPLVLELGKPFPNPNRSGAVLALAVPADRTGSYVAEVFDVRGRRVWRSRQDVAQAGRYRVVWEGRDLQGEEVGAGIYFLRVSGPQGFVQVRKLATVR
jgi:hypothetical protein